MTQTEAFMKAAIHQAQKALKADEVPIGCVIVHQGKIIARGWNQREKKQAACSHAEIEAIQKACKKLGTWRLDECQLYVTLEPCPMCAGAIIQSRIQKVYFGAYDPKGGAAGSVTNLFEMEKWNHHPTFEGGILEQECGSMLTDFFREKRAIAKARKKSRK